MLRNRDTTQKNQANLAVKATMCSKLTMECLDDLQNLTDDRNKHIQKVIQLAKDANTMSIDNFSTSQDHISKHVCSAYATEQHNQLMSALKHDKNVKEINNVSNHIVTDDMLGMYKDLVQLCSNDGQYLILYLLLLLYTSLLYRQNNMSLIHSLIVNVRRRNVI